ncbi:MAG: RNA polymerase sigma factor [Bacteroidia bacterium]|nr:RNA polymerase sigma factor [Bacteroidia bacterium]
MQVSGVPCGSLSDTELVRRSIAAPDYFACLYERYEARLLRYIRRLTHADAQEAEDLLQEAFIRIWRHLQEVDPELQFSSWAYRIVHNQAVTWMRRQHAFGSARSPASRIPIDTQWPDEAGGGEAQDANEAGIRTVLDRLSVEHREVLVLKYLESMSYDEISDVLKIPEGTVATRISRAKKAFSRAAEALHLTFTL